jgi:structural maintenance of chromosome 1
MPVTYLELENFKSYAGRQRIGPFHKFTSVIGPNGAGKSNLMDAISFVLGVQSRDLRSSQMKDLIFRPPGGTGTGVISDTNTAGTAGNVVEQEEEEDEDDDDSADEDDNGTPQKKKKKNKKKRKRKSKKSNKNSPFGAKATLVYVDAHTNEETRYSRVISSAGVGEYQLNGVPVTFKEYEDALALIGVLLKARNFLIFQGDVESMARKTPKQLTELFESVCGSCDLADEYHAALLSKEDAETSTLFAYNKLKGLKSERKLLKEQREEAAKYQAKVVAKANLQTEYFLWQLFHLDQDLEDAEERRATLEEDFATVTQVAEDDAKTQWMDAKKNASEARRACAASERTRVKLAGVVDQLQPSLIKAKEESKTTKKQIIKEETKLERLKEDAAKHDTTLAHIDQELVKYETAEQELQSKYEAVKKSGAAGGGNGGGGGEDDVVLTEAQEEEYQTLKEAAAVASSKPRSTLTKSRKRLDIARANAGRLDSDLKELSSNKMSAARDVEELQKRRDLTQKVSLLGLHRNILSVWRRVAEPLCFIIVLILYITTIHFHFALSFLMSMLFI